LNRLELHLASEKPAEMQGAAFEPGLVERILDDVGEKPGNLPLLEFTLTQLWERQSDGWLAHADYEAMGCVEGALAAYADQVYADFSEREQELTRRALVQLVQPGEGTEDTRRIATSEELGDESWELIQRLADRRLVVTGRDAAGRETAEVVHEALIQKWGLFREWMSSDRAFRLWQERLRGNLRQWMDSDRDEGALLAGAPLAVAQSWLAERGGELSPLEREYIQAGAALQIKHQKERQRSRQWAVIGLTVGLLVAIALGTLAFFQRQEALVQREKSQRQAAVLLAGQAETELANGYHDRAVLLALAAIENYPYTPQAEHALGQAVTYSRALLQIPAHQSAVTSLAWSPDGNRVASSGSSDNNVHIWNPATGETIRVIEMPEGITGNKFDMALNVQWAPDGKNLLVLTGDRYTLGSQDYDLLLWDATSGALISSLEIDNQAEPVSGDLTSSYTNYPTGAAAEIAPRSGRLATLGGDNTALIWDAAPPRTGGRVPWQEPNLVLTGHSDDVNSVDWSPNENRLVTASLDGTAIVWEAQTGKALHTLAGHEGRVNLALWSPDGKQIATAAADGILRLWDPADGSQVNSIETNAGEIFSLVWAPNSTRIITGHEDGSLRIWEVTSGKLLETLRGHQGFLSDLKWSPVDNRLASADHSGYARLWNAAQSTAWRLYPPQEARGGDWSISGGDWSSDSRYLVVAGGDNFDSSEPPSFAIWDVQSNTLHMENLGNKLNYYGAVAEFSPNDQAILYRGTGLFPDFSGWASAYVFDVQSGEIIRTFTPGEGVLTANPNWSPDGSQVATGLFEGGVIIWDYQTGNQVTRLVHDPGYLIGDVEWSPDGSKFAAASDDGNAHVWDTRTWKLLYTVQHEPPAYLNLASWSPDGTRLLTGGGNDDVGAKDTTARIWDGVTGKELLVFRGHSKSVWPGSWSPDGTRVSTFGAEGVAKVWDSSTGDELLTINVPVLYAGFALWSPDGQHLAIVGLDTLVSVWNVWQSKEELLDYARENYVIRELTEAERQQFGLP